MSRFGAGFLTASALWLAAGAAAWFVLLRPQTTPVVEAAPDAGVDAGAAEPVARRPRRRRRRRGRRASAAERRPDDAELSHVQTLGDDLGEDSPRTLDLAGGGGGEQQLSASQIEGAMDGVMGRVRRCLVLAAGEEPVHGRLVFGLRVLASGRVARVNLRGPRAVSAGECGQCLRQAARQAQFPSFDGPDMVVHYPLTLE